MKIQRPALISAAWFVGLGLVAFFPILFLGQCYDANDLLYQFAPWRWFLRDSIAAGHLPFWNPHSFAGQPFFADLQTQMLYPPNYLTLLPSIPVGMSWFVVLHLWIAVFGMRAWLRGLDLSEGAARVGALLYAFSGFFWWEIIHPPVLAAFAWVPWVFAAAGYFRRNPTARGGWLLGASYAMLFLSGSFQITLGATYALFLFELYCLWKDDRKTLQPKPQSRQWVLGAAAAVLGASLLFFQLFPTAQFSSLSVRENAGKDYDHFNSYWSLQPSTLGQYLLPRLGLPEGKSLETAIQDVTGDGGVKATDDNIGNDFLASFGFLGIWLPLLAFFAFREKRKPLAAGLLGLAVLALFVCFGKHFFLHRLLCSVAPGFSLLRTPFRFQFAYVLPMAALAALGYQALVRDSLSPGDKRLRRTMVWAYGAVALLFALVNPSQCWREILSLFLVASSVPLLERETSARWGRAVLTVGLVAPLILSGWDDFSIHPSSNLDLKRNAPWLETVQSKAGNGRTLLGGQFPYALSNGSTTQYVPAPTNASCVWGLKIPDGYNPLRLEKFAEVQTVPFAAFNKLTGIDRLFLLRKQDGEIPGFHLDLSEPLAVYSSTEPHPQLYAPAHWAVEGDPLRRLSRMRDPSFDPYQLSLLDQPVTGLALPDFAAPPAFQGTLVKETPDSQMWKVCSSTSVIGVFTDSAYPGWEASLDGQTVPLLQANHGFRAIPIAEGTHEIILRFKPTAASFLGFLIPLWLFAGGALFVLTRRRAKEASKP